MKVCSKCNGKYKADRCPVSRKAYRRQYHADNRDKYREACRNWRQINPDRAKELGLSWRRGLKEDVLRHYSGDVPSCSCCNEPRIEFLCLDHVDGGGNKQRATLKRSGTMFYSWIRRNNFPSGFRVLCHNCNMSMGSFGYCPHSKEAE